jgi:hypothetical protein
MHECLDVEPQGWAHACNIFIIEFLQYRGLSSIVKAAAPKLFGLESFLLRMVTYRNNSLISFSFCRFFRIIVSSPIRKVSQFQAKAVTLTGSDPGTGGLLAFIWPTVLYKHIRVPSFFLYATQIKHVL